jgi:hypothetical protein
MSLNLTNFLQGIQGRIINWKGTIASREVGVVLQDTASITWTGDQFGNISATATGSGGGVVTVTHLVGNSATPTIAAGSAAGTSPTLAMVAGATDLSGLITLTTGSAPAASATLAVVTFAVPYTAVPKVMFNPANAYAQAQVGAASPQVYASNVTETGFTITQGSTGLLADTAYEWSYLCTQ